MIISRCPQFHPPLITLPAGQVASSKDGFVLCRPAYRTGRFSERGYLYPMADVHDKATRSYNMSRIKGKDTKPEMIVRRFLHANGFRYRLHVKDLPGKPDIVLPKYRTVIFVHGCFWHGHEGCKYFKIPETRAEWWREKIGRTQLNNNLNIRELHKRGWETLIIWECQLKINKSKANTLQSLILKLIRYTKAN
jgi:DNA mismatch endonuclease (patch repair protein)